MNEFLDAALDYAGRGWPVFPVHSWTGNACTCAKSDCEHPAKHPRTGHGLLDATTDAGLIGGWWARWPNANIGVRTGVMFDVLDVDGGQTGIDALSAACNAAGGDLGAGPWVLTGGGGHHLYYRPAGINCRPGFLEKVDWKGDGGYVIMPPSQHASGRRYQWATAALLEDIGETSTGGDNGPDAPLQAAPGWLVDLLRPQAVQRPANVVPISEARRGTYGRAALGAECELVARAVEGARNDTLHKAAFRMGQLMAAGRIDAYQVCVALGTAGQVCGLGVPEIEATIASGISAGLKAPRGVAS